MRKAAALIAAVLLLFAAGGCEAKQQTYEMRRDLGVYFTNADEVVLAVREGLRSHSKNITVSYTTSTDSTDGISAVVKQIMDFATAETDDPREGDYILHQWGGYEIGYVCEGADGSYIYTVTITPDYYTYPSQEETVDARIAEIIASLGLDGKTELQKVQAVYDYVYGNVAYDLVHKKNPHYHLKTTAYAALVNGCAVCQGYSVLMYRLLREAGISARIITGDALTAAGTEYHAWNIVRIGGLYYNIDVTWDRQTNSHNYFLRGSESFGADHIPEAQFLTDSFLAEYPVSREDLQA